MGKLSTESIAYNGCVDVINEERDKLDDALETYNRAVKAAESLINLNYYVELKLVGKNTGVAY